MIGPLLVPGERFVIMTPYGQYEPCAFEVSAFRRVYQSERSRDAYCDKWLEELIDYATQQMESQWLAG